MKLENIDTANFIIEKDARNKGIYSRVVYYDPNTEKFYKIWGSNFFYKKYFEETYKTSFYQEVSLLEDIITDDNGEIVGYITPKAKNVHFSTKDSSAYRDLINALINSSQKHQLVYLDLNMENIVEKDNRYYIVDLEPVIKVENLHEIENLERILEYNNYYYMKGISNLVSSALDINRKISIVRHGTSWTKDIKYGTANGRLYLEHEYLPQLQGRTLFVGVNYYTNFYHLLTKDPELFETIDVDDVRVEDGSPIKHYVGNILDFEHCGYLYDNVCLFGVLGHADDWEVIKHKDGIVQCIEKLDSLVKPGGTLLLGPANQCFSFDWWDAEIYNSLPLFNNYSCLLQQKIDINYIWYGRKND